MRFNFYHIGMILGRLNQRNKLSLNRGEPDPSTSEIGTGKRTGIRRDKKQVLVKGPKPVKIIVGKTLHSTEPD